MADKYEDEVSGSPVVLPTITPWVAYTPVFNDQVATGVSFLTRQNGYNREVVGRFTMASNNATSAYWGLPNGELIDSAYLASANRMIGRFTGSTTLATQPKQGSVLGNSADRANLYIGIDDYTGTRSGLASTTWSALAVQTISFFASFPTDFTIANAFTAYGAGDLNIFVPSLVKKIKTTKVTPLAGATTAPSLTVKQSRVDDMINITVNASGLVTKDASAGQLSFVIDSEFRPSSNVSFAQFGLINNVSGTYLYTISPAGVVNMFTNLNGNTIAAGTTNCGWNSQISFSYSVA